MVSTIWWPMVKTGSNAVIGSWKTIAADLPRTCVSVVLVGGENIDAVERQGLGGDLRRVATSSRISARQVTDFPEPDSPTMPTLSPSST